MIATFPALVSALALLLYVAVFMTTGRLRARFDIKAPAVTGAPEFERAFRIQQNTLEQLVWFVPALWLFALYVSSTWGGIIGLVWIAGRAFYAISYYRDPETRGPGLGIGLVSAAVLLVGALIGIIAQLVWAGLNRRRASRRSAAGRSNRGVAAENRHRRRAI